jgi:hypothetical protein
LVRKGPFVVVVVIVAGHAALTVAVAGVSGDRVEEVACCRVEASPVGECGGVELEEGVLFVSAYGEGFEISISVAPVVGFATIPGPRER